ncbi:hypothetical protein SIN8267_01227 [Sinobacterium norvegicum]|uniref:DUF711 family protein n=1 Tax=Sinobacterium norvegicum TaxID=1641715 RepID=A0ABM9AEJ5_9GAMM|nr:DUF711 family protein [Sinobacterium norvegicum]CAH0991126.1 hypothetical protein SIN8267_01227 [Sinobacterium norvegicum]
MDYQQQHLCKVRTLTTFISLPRDQQGWQQAIQQASDFCADLTQRCQQAGYTVQSVRIVTNPFGEYLNTASLDGARADLTLLGELINQASRSGTRVRFAIGEAKTVTEIALLPALVQEFGDLCNVCVNIEADQFGLLDNAQINRCVEAVQAISRCTDRGEGNFNFTVNFNCQPLIPYFPASYHDSALGNRFVIGLETPDLLVEVLKDVNSRTDEADHRLLFQRYFDVMSTALQYHISAIQQLVEGADLDPHFAFSGFDSSAAPSKDCASMVEVYQQLGVSYFGAAGTVEASALLTRVFKSVDGVDLVGFSGLMLALTEDRGLAAGSINNDFDIRSLLTYSAVCGIGLDTVPIPGDTPADKIAALMRDTGTMAFRLNKPLTVRVFPVPGLSAGDMTAFESDDLCNCAVLAVP